MANDELSIDEQLDAYAAGINTTDAIRPEDTVSSGQALAADYGRRIQQVEEQREKPDLPWYQPSLDIASEMLTGSLVVNAYHGLTTHHNPDPEFTDERFEELTKEALQNGFPAEWLPELQDAYSEEHFNHLLSRAQSRLDAQARMGEFGWTMWGANFLAQLLDPASMVIAGGIIGPAYKAQRALRLGTAAQRGVQAAAGAASGLAVVAAEDAAGHQPSGYEYLFAAGLGGVLGAAFGPLSRNPATAPEAAAVARIGQRMMKEAETLMLPPPGKKATDYTPDGRPFRYDPDLPAVTQAGAARAAAKAAAPKPKVIDDPQRVLEVQIEAHRLHIEEAKEQLKGMKRGSPEAEEVRLAAVAAQKDMRLLEEQLKRLEDTGELPPSMRQPETPEEAPDFDLPDEIADTIPDAAIVRQRIADLEEQLRLAGDEDTADEIAGAIRELEDQLTGFTLVGDSYVPEAPRSAGAAVNPDAPDVIPEVPDFLGPNADGWRALKPGQTPTPAYANRRLDRSGRGGRTENEAAKLTFNSVFNDAVGKEGHVNTPFSLDQAKDKLFLSVRVPYYQARIAQFPEYAKAMGYNRLQRITRNGEFNRHVGLYLHSEGTILPDVPPAAQEAIIKTAEGLKQSYKMAIDRMREAGIPEALQTPDNEWFMPRKFNQREIQRIVSDPEYGLDAVIGAVRAGIKQRHDELGIEMSDRLLDRLSRGYTNNVVRRAYGLGDEWTIAINNGDRIRLRTLLKEDIDGITDAEVDELMSHLWSLRDKSKSSFGSLNQRVLLDATAADPRTGLKYHQILDLDADRVFVTYANQASGYTALANFKIRAPVVPRMRTVLEKAPNGDTVVKQVQDGFEGGHVIFNGIRTPADEQRLYDLIKQWGADHRTRTGEDISHWTNSDIQLLKYAFDRIKGVPDPREGDAYAQFLRDTRNYMFTRLMWQSGLAQSLETGIVIGSLGMKAAFSQVPGFRRIIDAAGNSRLQQPIFDELERIGIGTLRMPGMAFHHQEQIGDDLPIAPTSPRLRDRVSSALQYGTQVTNEYSGMGWITQMLERWAAAGVVQRIADVADRLQAGKKLRKGDLRRLAQLDLTEADLEEIFDQLQKHASKENRTFFKGRITQLHWDKWDNQAAAMKLQNAVFRYSRKLVQTGDIGNTAHFMSDPTWKTFLQFRNFTFTAWQNHTLYNLHMKDVRALITLVWAFGWAAAVRGAQVKAIAALRPDREEYEKRHLTTDALVRAAFQRTGTVSIVPAILDTIALFTGQGAVFDARHTGQPTDAFGGSPPVSFVKGLSDGIGGGIDSLVRQRPISQAEVRALIGSFPMATFIPFMAATSHLVKDLPARAPRREPLFGG